MTETRFKEIEHKFVVGDDFDLEDFRATMRGLGPVKTTVLGVRDVYYWSAHHPRVIFRHRYDRELQHLSVKSLEKDSEVRVEINLDLGQHRGDQQPAVQAFLETLDVAWRGEIEKEIEVYYFPDCEIVYYRASAREVPLARLRRDSRSVACVELEARGQDSIGEALAVLARYEQLTGFDNRSRTAKTLVEILFPEAVPMSSPALKPLAS